MTKHYSNGKIFPPILGKYNFLLIWNVIVRHVNKNFMSKKQYLYIEITKFYIYTVFNGSCIEHLLYTVVYTLHSFCKRMYIAYTTVVSESEKCNFFFCILQFLELKNHQTVGSPYWEVFKY